MKKSYLKLRLTAIALTFSLLFVQMPPVAAAGWWGNLTQQGQAAFSTTVYTAKQAKDQAAQGISNISVPEFSLPSVKVSNVSLPTWEQVSQSVSDLGLPEITVPDMEQITQRIQTIDVPDVNIDIPNISIPNIELDLSQIAMPNIEIPDINVPNINIDIARILPGIDFNFDFVSLRENLQCTLTQASNITKQLYQQGTEVFDNLDLMSLVIGGGAAYTTISKSLSGVPQDFYALLKEMPKVAKRVRYGAGLREGGRSAEDAYKLFQKIPGAALMEATERKVQVFLSNKDGSHIISDQNSGSSSSSNIFWELRSINNARSSLNTTQLELIVSRLYNGAEAIVQNSGTVAKLGLQATSIAVLVDALVEAEIHAIELVNGEITVDEFLTLILDAAERTLISAAAFYTLTVIAISIFPELVPVLSAPTLVTASQIILGSRLALPLLRLIPAL